MPGLESIKQLLKQKWDKTVPGDPVVISVPSTPPFQTDPLPAVADFRN